MLDDEQLDRLLEDTKENWRVESLASPESLWEDIEGDAFSPMPRRWVPGWRTVALATAASLLLGVALGRGTSTLGRPAPLVTIVDTAMTLSPVSSVDNPYSQTTDEFLGRTALLLAALPAGSLPPGRSSAIATQGGELLTTSRMLLDSPAGLDPEMRKLLEDLELVLAQVARLRAPASNDLELIHDAVDRNDIVPRLRSAVIGTSPALN